MITLSQDQLGLWSIPNLITLDPNSGDVVLDRTVLPEASQRIVFGHGLGAQCLASRLEARCVRALAIVGSSSSKSQRIQEILEKISSAKSDVHILEVEGRADHEAVYRGIQALHETQAEHVIAIGGGTTLDVAKSVAGLARQEGRLDIAAFQTEEKTVDPKKVVPWIAVPTTSGTGSESTNNAVIELGDEKRSIRHIPPPAMIIADPALTDSLPLSATIVSAVDALAQSLEVATHAKASPQVQAVALAAFLNLAEGLEALMPREESVPVNDILAESSVRSDDNDALLANTTIRIEPHTRDVLSWGSLLMGLAFAHAGLGLPHALAHFCMRFGMSHGHMVGILLAPGLEVQAAQNRATAVRLQRIQEAFIAPKEKQSLSLSFEDETTDLSDLGYDKLLGWLEDSIGKLFAQVGLPTSLGQVGLSLSDLDWIASREHALGASFGIPRRRATKDELIDVLKKAF